MKFQRSQLRRLTTKRSGGKAARFLPRRSTSLTAWGLEPRSLPDPSWIQSERAAALAVTWGWSRGYKREIKPTGRNVPLASKNNDYTSSIPLYELQTKQRPLIGFLHRMLISQRRLHFSHMLAFQMGSSWAPTFPTPTSELALGQYRRAFTAFLAGADSSLSHFRASRNRIDLSVWLDSTV